MCEGAAASAAMEAAGKENKKSLMGLGAKSLHRALQRIRDKYVSSLGSCAGTGGGGGRATDITGVFAGMGVMPRARSTSAFGQKSYSFGPDNDDDFRELVRVNSQQLDAAAISTRPAVTVVPRSQSVATTIGRIDEERPCEFNDGDDVKLGIPMTAPYWRSRSCAVVPTGRRTMAIGA